MAHGTILVRDIPRNLTSKGWGLGDDSSRVVGISTLSEIISDVEVVTLQRIA
ncbi:hypothetical protein HanXRQr2_Chr14g0620861 [Helianthus annuus]|uniref:Uncharacterized protein n=1 Tax=Helianthus annuus TaxID=4232 RepID=A0A9K3E6M9_HELAN|nr:hypothetical protein HanXRQr2_Chr14g0620861 [Helianthus annuus]